MSEIAQLVAMLQDAGLVAVHEDEDDREACRLTDAGAPLVGNMLALAGRRT